MKTNEPRDDEILGRALSRAIETLDVTETPYEHSRLTVRPLKRGTSLWRVMALAAAVVLALALGSVLVEPSPTTGPAAEQPTSAPSATNTPAATATTPTALYPSPTPTPSPNALDHDRVYVARDGLPPVSVHVDSAGVGATPGDRVGTRLSHLPVASPPPGAFNAMPKDYQALAINGGSSGVRVQGDLVTVDYVVPQGDWKVRGAAQTLALVQQLVYTATEEPGIRRVLITENGGKPTRIDQLVWDKPLSREDVFGYSFVAGIGKDKGISFGGDDSVAHVAGLITSTLVLPGDQVRITIEGRTNPGGEKVALPSYEIYLEQSDDTKPSNAKYALTVVTQWNGGGSSGGAAGTTYYDQTPLRAITSNRNNVHRIELDDARPWRAYMPDKTQLVVEIGGDPRTVSDRIAVTSPHVGDTVTPDLRITGAARVFEANVSWRLKDRAQKLVASGNFTASLGTSALWGTFDTRIQLPASAVGSVALEIFEASAKDGSDVGLVSIPLTLTAR